MFPAKINDQQIKAVPTGTSPFDALRHVRPDGSEYWSARELMPYLGYAKWQNMLIAIARAKASCLAHGLDPANNFTGASKVLQRGKAGPTGQDYELSRGACYLTAMNGDPRKQGIADAQNYFLVKTREAELGIHTQQAVSAQEHQALLIELGVMARALARIQEGHAQLQAGQAQLLDIQVQMQDEHRKDNEKAIELANDAVRVAGKVGVKVAEVDSKVDAKVAELDTKVDAKITDTANELRQATNEVLGAVEHDYDAKDEALRQEFEAMIANRPASTSMVNVNPTSFSHVHGVPLSMDPDKMTMRQKVEALAEIFIDATGLATIDGWDLIFRKHRHMYSFDTIGRANRAGKAPLDVIERVDRMEELYLVVSKMCSNAVACNLLKPQRGRR